MPTIPSRAGDSRRNGPEEEINAKLSRLKEYVVRVEVFLSGVDALKGTGGPGKNATRDPRQWPSTHCGECRGQRGEKMPSPPPLRNCAAP